MIREVYMTKRLLRKEHLTVNGMPITLPHGCTALIPVYDSLEDLQKEWGKDEPYTELEIANKIVP